MLHVSREMRDSNGATMGAKLAVATPPPPPPCIVSLCRLLSYFVSVSLSIHRMIIILIIIGYNSRWSAFIRMVRCIPLGMCCGPGLYGNGICPEPFVGHIHLIQPPVRYVQVCEDFQAVIRRNRASLEAFSVSFIAIRYGTVWYGTTDHP